MPAARRSSGIVGARVSLPLELIGTATTASWNHSANSTAISVPTGAAEGDTLVLFMADENYGTLNGATGFSVAINAAASGNQPHCSIRTRKIVGAPPSSFSLTGSGTAYRAVFVLMCVRNVHSSPLSGTYQNTANDTVGTAWTSPSMTPGHAKAMAVCFGVSKELTLAVSSAQGFTNRATVQVDSASDIRAHVRTKADAGTSPVTFPSFSQGNNYYRGVSFALKPA